MIIQASVIIALLYAIYALISALSINDDFFESNKALLSLSDDELREIIIDVEDKHADMAIKEDLLNGTNESRINAIKAMDKAIRVKEDEAFLDKRVNDFLLKVKTLSFRRRAKKFGWILIRDLYTLIPVAVLILTFNIPLSLIVSGVLMFIFSMLEEHMIRSVLSDIYSEEISDLTVSSFQVRASIAIIAVSRQSVFYFILLLLLL